MGEDVGPVNWRNIAISLTIPSGAPNGRHNLRRRLTHHISMDEKQTSAPPSTLNPARWVAELVAAVILAEGIWGLLASLTSNLLVPLLARVMDGDPQSPSYLGRGELKVPALFNSFLAFCLAWIVFVLLHGWSQGLSRSNHYQTPHLLLRSPRRTLAHSIAAFGINSIALLHPQ